MKSSSFLYKGTFNPMATGQNLNAPYLLKEQIANSSDVRTTNKYLQTNDRKYTQLVNIKKLLLRQKMERRRQ